MATSGSIDFSVSRDNIITEALQMCGVVSEGGTPTSTQYTECARTLNMVVKYLQSKGYNIFAISKMILFPKMNTYKYTISGSSGDHCCLESDLVQTTVKTAYSAGVTLDVTTTTGMTNADAIGVVLDDGSLVWKTLTVVDSDTVTLSGALGGTAAAGNVVYTYTAKVNRPLKILTTIFRDQNGTDVEANIISKYEYDTIPLKTTTSNRPNQVYYDPQLAAGYAYVWPANNDMRVTGVFTIARTLEDFDNSTDTPDFPQEWYLLLCVALAYFLMTKYGCDQGTKADISQKYVMLVSDDYSWDTETDTSVFLMPETRY